MNGTKSAHPGGLDKSTGTYAREPGAQSINIQATIKLDGKKLGEKILTVSADAQREARRGAADGYVLSNRVYSWTGWRPHGENRTKETITGKPISYNGQRGLV